MCTVYTEAEQEQWLQTEIPDQPARMYVQSGQGFYTLLIRVNEVWMLCTIFTLNI